MEKMVTHNLGLVSKTLMYYKNEQFSYEDMFQGFIGCHRTENIPDFPTKV